MWRRSSVRPIPDILHAFIVRIGNRLRCGYRCHRLQRSGRGHCERDADNRTRPMCVVQNLFRRKPAARPMRHRDSKDTRCFPGDEYGQRTTQTIYRRHRGGRRGLNGARPGAEPGRRRIFLRSGRLTAAGRGRSRAHRARQVARAGQRQGFRRGRRWRRRRSRRDPGRDRSTAVPRRRPFVSAGRYLQRRRGARSVRDRSPLDRWLRPGQHDHPQDFGDGVDLLLRRRS